MRVVAERIEDLHELACLHEIGSRIAAVDLFQFALRLLF